MGYINYLGGKMWLFDMSDLDPPMQETSEMAMKEGKFKPPHTLPDCVRAEKLMKEVLVSAKFGDRDTNLWDLFVKAKQGVELKLNDKQLTRLSNLAEYWSQVILQPSSYSEYAVTPSTLTTAMEACRFILSMDLDQRSRVPLRKIMQDPPSKYVYDNKGNWKDQPDLFNELDGF